MELVVAGNFQLFSVRVSQSKIVLYDAKHFLILLWKTSRLPLSFFFSAIIEGG